MVRVLPTLPRSLSAQDPADSNVLRLVGSDGLSEICRNFVGFRPILAAVSSYIHGEFEAAPYTHLVEDAAKMVLDDLLGRSLELSDLAVGQTFPDENRDLDLFRSKALTQGS